MIPAHHALLFDALDIQRRHRLLYKVQETITVDGKSVTLMETLEAALQWLADKPLRTHTKRKFTRKDEIAIVRRFYGIGRSRTELKQASEQVLGERSRNPGSAGAALKSKAVLTIGSRKSPFREQFRQYLKRV